MKNQVLVIVVTYYPESGLLTKNINAFINHVDRVLIWENTPESEKMQYRFVKHDKVEYCGDGVNSISHALNFAWNYAYMNGYDYLLTMDQDSKWNNFGLFLEKTIYSANAPKGIWTPLVIEKELICEYDEIHLPITSGMLIKTELLNNIGGWNEFFKIDSVDNEFYLRAKGKGYKFYVVRGTTMTQNFGEPVKAFFIGCPIVLTNYSPKRLFSIFKNLVILIFIYPSQIYLWNNFVSWLKRMLFIICFEKNKTRKLYSMVSGIVSGVYCVIVHYKSIKQK